MKKFLIGAALCALPLFSQADTRQDVEELMGLLKVDTMMDSMYAQMNQMMAGMTQQLDIQPDEQAIYQRFHQKMNNLMRTEMGYEQMKEPMIAIYLKHFSEKEIQDMVTFYKTDTGKALVEKMPQVMGETMQISQAAAMAMMPKMQQLQAELADELEQYRSSQ